MMPLEKQSLSLFTHPFRYCRDNPHPPGATASSSRECHSTCVEEACRPEFTPGPKSNWDAQMVIFQQCHEGTLNYSCLTA
jgi:hypothetical protein